MGRFNSGLVELKNNNTLVFGFRREKKLTVFLFLSRRHRSWWLCCILFQVSSLSNIKWLHVLVELREREMFTNNQRQEERTGKTGTPRLQYLQELVSQFQNATGEQTKEKIVANLANFSYDPYNYTILRQLNVLELFIDCLTEPNEKLVEFGMGGICNACAEPKNAATIVEADGIPLIIKCLSSPVRNTVNYALGALYYICDYNRATREMILRAEVLDLIERYAAAETVCVSFSNLAKAFLDKHVHART
ncbi:hypothetical protein HA466_0168890 [Hirschfeldia incana]|nr:hypothetical protein HA466_0168890 [Hirschfeldia incana]